MTFVEVEAFLAVVKTGTVSRAAEALSISQPALSKRLKSLEGELGYALLLRKPGIRSIELTEAGKNLIEPAERWLLLWHDIRNLGVKKLNPVLRISSLDSIGTYFLPPVCRDFLGRNGQVLLDVQALNSYPAYDQMEAGLLDLAFTMDQRFSEKVMTLPAFSESMQLVASSGYDLPQTVHPSALAPEREIHISWSTEFKKWYHRWFSESPHPYITIEKMAHLEYLIQHTPSWAIVPSSVASALGDRLAVHTGRLEDPPPKRISNYLTILGHKREYVNAFLSCLRSHIQGMAIPGVEVLF